ncbi:MAG: DNA mismatch repair protein MutS, partial [Myxococcales bacterium]
MSEPLPAVEGSASGPATPMLRQYNEAKAQARDALLLFRLGDFYELFYEDAKIASQILGITLTSRAKGDDRVPMAGVPYHAARQYIARLVAAGHKVAICDQMEEPGPGKALVRREIVRLVTPGTLLDDDHLDARTAVWLASVAVDGPRAAVALLDASTGELRALPPGPFESAVDELSRARPREVLLPDTLLGTLAAASVRRASGAARVEGRPQRLDAEALLKRHLGVATLDGYGLRDPLSISA